MGWQRLVLSRQRHWRHLLVLATDQIGRSVAKAAKPTERTPTVLRLCQWPLPPARVGVMCRARLPVSRLRELPQAAPVLPPIQFPPFPFDSLKHQLRVEGNGDRPDGQEV